MTDSLLFEEEPRKEIRESYIEHKTIDGKVWAIETVTFTDGTVRKKEPRLMGITKKDN